MWHRIKTKPELLSYPITRKAGNLLDKKHIFANRKTKSVKQKQALLGSNLYRIAETNKGVSTTSCCAHPFGACLKNPNPLSAVYLAKTSKVNYLNTISQLQNQYVCLIYAYYCWQNLMSGLIINYYEPNIYVAK